MFRVRRDQPGRACYEPCGEQDRFSSRQPRQSQSRRAIEPRESDSDGITDTEERRGRTRRPRTRLDWSLRHRLQNTTSRIVTERRASSPPAICLCPCPPCQPLLVLGLPRASLSLLSLSCLTDRWAARDCLCVARRGTHSPTQGEEGRRGAGGSSEHFTVSLQPCRLPVSVRLVRLAIERASSSSGATAGLHCPSSTPACSHPVSHHSHPQPQSQLSPGPDESSLAALTTALDSPATSHSRS